MIRILLIVFLFGVFDADGQDTSYNQIPVTQLIDSIQTLEDGCILLGWSADEEFPAHLERELSILQSFFALDSISIKKFLKSEKRKIRFYAFGTCCEKYPSIVADQNLEIYRDTGKVVICTPAGDEKIDISMAEMAKDIYRSTMSMNDVGDNEDAVVGAVQDFIIQYSKYPNTYEPIGFEEFAYGVTVGDNGTKENSENYEIKHSYSIMNNDGEEVTISHYFKLNFAMEITLIEEELTGIYNEYPREKLIDWLTKYGRKLSDSEANKLKVPNNG